jgi:hypothetical protein
VINTVDSIIKSIGQEILVQGSNAPNVKIVAAIFTVVGLTFVLVLSTSLRSDNVSTIGNPMLGAPTSNGVTTTGLLSPATPTCVAPPPPVQIISQVGVPPFTLVGANTMCAVAIPSPVVGSISLANLSVGLNVAKPLRMYMVIDINNNGTSSVPDGTTFTATYGTQSFAVHDDLHPAQTRATVVTLATGEAIFHLRASIPNSYKSGTYFFMVGIFASYEDNGSTVAYSNWIPVNLDAQ